VKGPLNLLMLCVRRHRRDPLAIGTHLGLKQVTETPFGNAARQGRPRQYHGEAEGQDAEECARGPGDDLSKR
jgi:hypothetical protein